MSASVERWATGMSACGFIAEAAYSGNLLIMMLLKYCLSPPLIPLFNKHWLSVFGDQVLFPKHRTRCIMTNIKLSSVSWTKEFVRDVRFGELVSSALAPFLPILIPDRCFYMQNCSHWPFLKGLRPDFFVWHRRTFRVWSCLPFCLISHWAPFWTPEFQQLRFSYRPLNM